jgi:hypothetical protein
MSETKKTRVPVAERALLARINRQLAHEGRRMKRCADNSPWHAQLGDYYVLDMNRNTIDAQFVSIEAWGREAGVLKDWEALIEG